LVERVFSKNWVFPVIIQVYLFQLGACISYIIFFMEFLDNAIYGQEEIEFRHQLTYGALALLIIIPTIFTDSMSFYANLSIAANVLI
jgi:proton-coupled amino acid transporter